MTDDSTDFNDYLSPRRGERPGKRVEAAEAFAAIPDQSRVFIEPGCGTPLQILEEMAAARGNWDRLNVVLGQILAPIAIREYADAPFRFVSVQPSEYMAARSNGGPADPVPARYSDSERLFGPGGPLEADVAIIQVSPPGPGGKFSLGLSVGSTIDVVRTARVVIAQVNREMPYTFGAGELERSEIDYLVEIDGPVVELKRPPISEESQEIARHAVTQVPDEATLQFGIGAVPEALMSLLVERRDLGIHSGMIGEGIMALMESGALTNAKKTMDRGVMISGEVLGTRTLFDWVHENPNLRMAPASYTHGTVVLPRCHRFTSIQSALQVSLDGTINAESLGDKQVAGTGGQPDYAAAAAAAPGGIAIHALPATAARGKVSRIVPQLDAGAIVTTPRYLADRIVTEFGVAELRGRSIEERAANLRAIAHPEFRGELDTA